MTRAVADGVMLAACVATRLDEATIRGKCGGAGSRKRLSPTRFAVMLVLRERTGWSLPRIGQYMGGRDHTSIGYGCGRALVRMATDAGFARLVERLRAAPELVPGSTPVVTPAPIVARAPKLALRRERNWFPPEGVTAEMMRNGSRRLADAMIRERARGAAA